MRNLFFVILFCIASFNSFAQGNYFVPTEKGVTLLYKVYDSKGKPEKMKGVKDPLWMKYTVKDCQNYPDSVIVNMFIESNIFDHNNEIKALTDDIQNLTLKISGDTLYLKNFLQNTMTFMNQEFPQSGEFNINVKGDGSYPIPCNLSVGEKMADRTVMEIAYTVNTLGLKGVGTTFSCSYKDKVVEAMEEVVTPAGSFQCYRMSYKNISRFEAGIFKQSSEENVVEWISPGIGTVKTERRTKKGKIIDTQVLEEVSRL